MVVLSRWDYISNAKDFWHEGTHTDSLTAEPNNKHKNKLINMLRTNKAEGGLWDITYIRLYPTGAGPPNSMGYPRSTRRHPLS